MVSGHYACSFARLYESQGALRALLKILSHTSLLTPAIVAPPT